MLRSVSINFGVKVQGETFFIIKLSIQQLGKRITDVHQDLWS